MSTKNHIKPIILVLASVIALGLGRVQYGTETPLDYANNVVVFIAGISHLLEINSKDKDK
ncbi:hypothetical protein OGM63_06805 [Plectonema radiosum NIES-515]|uniref:Uncharacterized protein n=1 Tax=Plectonema radiosum NIES-515 TaxID=2986073 RepID=A0ABT3AW25_9CYAN|nr:hypothetical protein [Plectonema radiosum]MCV3213235.1 hypothetical protein [Plectonema radiosum NIES-515]